MPGFIVYGDDGTKQTEACDSVVEVVRRLLARHATFADMRELAGVWFDVSKEVVQRERLLAEERATRPTAVVPASECVRYLTVAGLDEIDDAS